MSKGLEVRGLGHRFGELVAVDGVDLDVGPGEIVGLVGRNGAGKTTTMRALMGILLPDRGELRWEGRPLEPADRLRFGYMPEERGLYPQMRLADQVGYFARLHGLPAAEARARTASWLERLGLAARRDERVVALSHGNQQRAQLAVAVVHDPDLLVLDEPFSGLDPEAVLALSGELRSIADRAAAVLLSSHQLDLVERLCDRVVVLEGGRVLASGSLADLRTEVPARLRVRVAGRPDWVPDVAGTTARPADGGVVVALAGGADPQAVLRAALEAGPVEHFGWETPSLLDVYRELVRR